MGETQSNVLSHHSMEQNQAQLSSSIITVSNTAPSFSGAELTPPQQLMRLILLPVLEQAFLMPMEMPFHLPTPDVNGVTIFFDF